MQHLHTSSPLATICFGINWLFGLFWLFYIVGSLSITTPYKPSTSRHFRVLNSCLFVMVAYGRAIVCFIAGQYVQACTTKYIFKLGKNKFDRTEAIFSGQGLAGGSRLGDKER